MVNGVLLFVYFSSIRIKNCIYTSHCFYYIRLSRRRNECYLLLNSCEGRHRRRLVTVRRTVRRAMRRAVAGAKRVRTTRVQNWRTKAKRVRGQIWEWVRVRGNGRAGRCAGRCKTKQARERAREYECETDASVREGARGKVHVRKAHAP